MRPLARPLAAIAAALWGLLGLVFALALVAAMSTAVVMTAVGKRTEEVTVPQLRGLDPATAEQDLATLGLRFKVVAHEYDPKVSPGRIVSSKPYAGKRVKMGRVVECTLSLGPRTIKMPKLVGHTAAGAESRLRELGFSSIQLTRRADDTPRDEVLAQHPSPGTPVDRKHPVELVVSGGPGFGSLETPDGKRWLFRRLRITVPEGPALQRVRVLVRSPSSDEAKTYYDRVHKPGDTASINISGPAGSRLSVLIEDEEVLTTKL